MPKPVTVHPVGIDLGTTYSCISYLTPAGQPETIPNAEGELSTPSVVMFDGDEVIVGTEALRSVVAQPERGVVHVKRFMGDPQKCWVIDGQVYRPLDISALILRKLLQGAEERIGHVRHAVITVPAQFSEIQRQQTVEAGLRAGLERVDIINEPVAAALCYVLGEGMWFSELANDQTIMVFDLGGGTFDLSLVKYNKAEVRVIASGGDLNLGGLDWNRALEQFLCDEFSKVSHADPRLDRESMQALAIEVEQVKRTLSVRSKASCIVQHQGQRKVFALDRDLFELLTKNLVQRTEEITRGLLKAHKLGWAHVDAVLVTGGATRMPMVRDMLQRISGTTLNSSLSPDQSICHGAAYYAGMLLSGQKLERTTLNKEASARLSSFKQQSVNARALGILVKDVKTGQRFPHYLIPANSPLPTSVEQQFGTVSDGQKRVHLHIVESGASESDPHVELGACVVDGLAARLPAGSPINVTIRYDEQARVHVEAWDVTSGARAEALIVRKENITAVPATSRSGEDAQLVRPQTSPATPKKDALPPPSKAASKPVVPPAPPARIPVGTNVAAPPRPVPVPPQAPLEGEKTPQKPAAKPPALPANAASGTPPRATPGRAAPATPSAVKKSGPAGSSRPPQISTHLPLEEAERPVPLCNRCGEPLGLKGECRRCLGKGSGKGSALPRKATPSRSPRPEKVRDDPTDKIDPAPKARRDQPGTKGKRPGSP